ncbi:MAG: nitrilase-related carbon-nitrogen hydrolase [Pirellulales bacterium]
MARSLGIVLVGGTFCEQSADPNKAHNTSLLIDSAGEVRAVYRKLHLFDVDLPGKLTYCESSWLAPGTRRRHHVSCRADPHVRELRSPAQADAVVTAAAICYDLRFPDCFAGLPTFARCRRRACGLH